MDFQGAKYHIGNSLVVTKTKTINQLINGEYNSAVHMQVSFSLFHIFVIGHNT